jgi:hypothetical protein
MKRLIFVKIGGRNVAVLLHCTIMNQKPDSLPLPPSTGQMLPTKFASCGVALLSPAKRACLRCLPPQQG